ncbi:MAG: hypothetical protein KatS3mg051_2139 [Anaerolineae bacterium]|nr:MAG: hypothetical protein KatS3mg051_2139 [Anaerolineae bacterium]
MPVKAAGNVTVTYNGQNIKAYCNSADLQATIDQIDVTDFASTAKEFITGFGEWTINLGGPWDPTLDGYLAPDAVTPGTKRTASIAFDDGSTTVTYTWTSNAEIGDYQIQASNPTEAITWSAVLRLSGAPTRSTS